MKPYTLFSRIYDEAWSGFSAGYIPFLKTLGERHPFSMNAILDLACGTGSLVFLLASKAERVVGLDLSAEMLEIARRKCRSLGNVGFVQGDFRSFDLDEKFDLVISCFDSLNYIERIGELTDVFRCVERHLNGGGFFVFDVVTERHMVACDGFGDSFELAGIKYEHSGRYYPDRKVNEVVFRFEAGDEVHRQIPVEYNDVLDAAETTGLSLVEAFSGPKFEPVDDTSRRFFFALTREG